MVFSVVTVFGVSLFVLVLLLEPAVKGEIGQVDGYVWTGACVGGLRQRPNQLTFSGDLHLLST